MSSFKLPVNKVIAKQKGIKMLKELKENNEKLEKINQSIQVLLETKRNLFPRFYFLSDDEVLEVIANSELDRMQGMLNKIFDGITRLGVNDQNSIN